MRLLTLVRRTDFFFVVVAILTFAPTFSSAQQKQIVWSADEKPLADQIHGLRALADDVRAGTTRDLALKVRKLPSTENKLRLALGLAGLSTEGDFGHDTLQEVATTLAETLRDRPVPWAKEKNAIREPAYPYVELATLVRYEHVEASLINNDEQFLAAMARLEADDGKREHLDFTLKDLSDKTWTFSELRGKVVLVNFWATWCPPCRKEMPDLDQLYKRFGSKGLVVLGISDEEMGKVEPFVREKTVSFPVLLDPGRTANIAFGVEGIPKTFIFDRDGKLIGETIDQCTGLQFLKLLSKTDLHP